MKLILHTVIYINHEIVLDIIKQISIITSFIAKLNLRLIRVLKYIQRFRNLEFRHKSGKQYIVSNAFNRFN